MADTALIVLAGFSLLCWLYLLFGRAGFWRADQKLEAAGTLARWPHVCAIIPARNEAQTIGQTVKSLLAQDYAGRLDLIVVDDESVDRTADIAMDAARKADAANRVRVIAAPPLAPGWSGKLWALHHGVTAAGEDAVFLWFTDADIVHASDVLSRLVNRTKGDDGRDLVSLMVRLRVESVWERWLVPAFIFFFQMLYPFPAINDPKSPVAGAAGGCILVRREMFEKAGGISAMKDALIDDCTLAAQVQKAGGRLWLGLADSSHSLRGSDGLWPLWVMVKRTAFTQLHYSAWLLIGTVAGLGLIFLAPPLIGVAGLLTGNWPAFVLAGAAMILMGVAYRPTLRHYERALADALALPVIAGLYAAMTVHSAMDHWFGRGSQWKGRSYGAGSGA